MDKSIGEKLAQLRKQNDMTQNDLAVKLQVSYQAVSKWERNENLPDVFTLQKIAEIYGISIDELIGDEPTKSNKLPTPIFINILKVIGILLILISPIPFLTRSYTDTLGGILGSSMSFLFGFAILLFIYLEQGRYKN